MRLPQALINPVVSMEFRLRMRSKKTPWIIVLYLLALSAIIFTFIYFQTGQGGYFNPSRSRELFITLSFIQFALVSFITPGLTAGVISGEREKQTLNILLTTNLSSTKIIIGKWLSSLSFMILLIFTSMPLYSIVFLYGGISPEQLVKVFGFYFIGMLAIGSFGVLFSTLIRRTGVATIVTYATIIAYSVITSIVPQLIQSIYYQSGQSGRTQRPIIIDWFYSINPFTGMLNIFESQQIQNLPLQPYWIFIIFFSLITVIVLLMAIHFIKPVRKLKLFKKI